MTSDPVRLTFRRLGQPESRLCGFNLSVGLYYKATDGFPKKCNGFALTRFRQLGQVPFPSSRLRRRNEFFLYPTSAYFLHSRIIDRREGVFLEPFQLCQGVIFGEEIVGIFRKGTARPQRAVRIQIRSDLAAALESNRIETQFQGCFCGDLCHRGCSHRES